MQIGKLYPESRLIPKGKLSMASMLRKPKNKKVGNINEQKKGINIYLILLAAYAAYYFLIKKQRQ